MRESRTYGSVRAKAEWLSYSTTLGGGSATWIRRGWAVGWRIRHPVRWAGPATDSAPGVLPDTKIPPFAY
jgi:hypothetical protein